MAQANPNRLKISAKLSGRTVTSDVMIWVSLHTGHRRASLEMEMNESGAGFLRAARETPACDVDTGFQLRFQPNHDFIGLGLRADQTGIYTVGGVALERQKFLSRSLGEDIHLCAVHRPISFHHH
jgi:hypothetical protein